MSTIAKPLPASDTTQLFLEPGDHLSRAEFERRYDSMPDVKKAELIEGVVWKGSAVRFTQHARPHACLMLWLGQYWNATPGVEFADNATVRLDELNEIQPDGVLFINTKQGGNSRISEDDYLEGPPELVAEIASSSVSFDLHVKKQLYQRHGVKEYIVWRVLDRAIDWFILRNDQYQPLLLQQQGYLESETFPGLRLEPAAMANLEMPTVLKVLQEGLASQVHASFVAHLQTK